MKTALLPLLLTPAAIWAAEKTRPNIVFILADDLGIGDVGCYGQTKIKTPNIDRLAAEGLRFTQAYSPTSVCAPTRASFITGLHQGHSPIRHNQEIPGGQMPLPEGSASVARTLKDAGYATGCFGKWGLGPVKSSGDPQKIGFDQFFGYICQAKAHHYYPQVLQDNGADVELGGKTYSADLIAERMNAWLKKQAATQKPFFLFHSTTLPHTELSSPHLDLYADKDWPKGPKTYAAMVTTLDNHVGAIVKTLKDAGVYENTLIIFSSDNGYAGPAGNFFNSTSGFRGNKRSMYEGGLREPFIAVWPGKIAAGKTNDKTPVVLYDLHATFASAAGAKAPGGDGMDLMPLFTSGVAPKRDMLYFELYEPNFRQAARIGDMKVVIPSVGAKPELYDLSKDPEEKNNLAEERADFLKAALARMEKEHSPYANERGKGAKAKKRQ